MLHNIHLFFFHFVTLLCCSETGKALCHMSNNSWQLCLATFFHMFSCWDTFLFCTLKFTDFTRPHCPHTKGKESVSSNCSLVDQKEDVAVAWPFACALQFFTITINQYGDFSTFLKHEKCLFLQMFLFKISGSPSGQIKKMYLNPANGRRNG